MTITVVMVCKHLKFIECALGCNDTDTDIDECMEQIHQYTHLPEHNGKLHMQLQGWIQATTKQSFLLWYPADSKSMNP